MKRLADENLRNAIIRGILRQYSAFDIVRAQDIAGVSGRDDLTLLRFATSEGRVLITQDVSTIVPARHALSPAGSQCAPVVVVPARMPIGDAVRDVILLDKCAVEADWTAGVLYLPLR